MKKIGKIFRISGLVSSIIGVFYAIATNNSAEAFAWICCSIWIVNIIITESILKQAEELVNDLKKQIENKN
jgi:hypothetical protein